MWTFLSSWMRRRIVWYSENYGVTVEFCSCLIRNRVLNMKTSQPAVATKMIRAYFGNHTEHVNTVWTVQSCIHCAEGGALKG